MRHPARLALLVIGLLTAVVARASATTIGDVLDSPTTFDHQVVTVTGVVVDPALGYRTESAYNLQDGDRRISIFSGHTPPATGARLQVTGKVGYKAPDEEFSFPPVILESNRQPAP